MEPRFCNPWIEIQKHGFNLPHWQQPGATYFLTFRLADSIPAALLDSWKRERKTWLASHLEPWNEATEREYHDRFSRRLDSWMDEGHGECLLRDPGIATEVSRILLNFDEGRYAHHAWVVMPNHVHLLFTLAPEQMLEKVVQGWKGVSANRINKALGRRGHLWQEDYFDRLVRDGEHFWKCARYIRWNPKKAGLSEGGFLLWESESAKERLDECGL